MPQRERARGGPGQALGARGGVAKPSRRRSLRRSRRNSGAGNGARPPSPPGGVSPLCAPRPHTPRALLAARRGPWVYVAVAQIASAPERAPRLAPRLAPRRAVPHRPPSLAAQRARRTWGSAMAGSHRDPGRRRAGRHLPLPSRLLRRPYQWSQREMSSRHLSGRSSSCPKSWVVSWRKKQRQRKRNELEANARSGRGRDERDAQRSRLSPSRVRLEQRFFAKRPASGSEALRVEASRYPSFVRSRRNVRLDCVVVAALTRLFVVGRIAVLCYTRLLTPRYGIGHSIAEAVFDGGNRYVNFGWCGFRGNTSFVRTKRKRLLWGYTCSMRLAGCSRMVVGAVWTCARNIKSALVCRVGYMRPHRYVASRRGKTSRNTLGSQGWAAVGAGGACGLRKHRVMRPGALTVFGIRGHLNTLHRSIGRSPML